MLESFRDAHEVEAYKSINLVSIITDCGRALSHRFTVKRKWMQEKKKGARPKTPYIPLVNHNRFERCGSANNFSIIFWNLFLAWLCPNRFCLCTRMCVVFPSLDFILQAFLVRIPCDWCAVRSRHPKESWRDQKYLQHNIHSNACNSIRVQYYTFMLYVAANTSIWYVGWLWIFTQLSHFVSVQFSIWKIVWWSVWWHQLHSIDHDGCARQRTK